MWLIRRAAAASGEPGGLLPRALDELPDTSVLVFDTDMRYVLVRGGAVRDNGMDPDALEGRIAGEVLPPDRWAFYRPLFEAALRGQRTSSQVASPDGTRDYTIRCAPIADDRGTVLGGVLVATEVTGLRAAERARRRSDNQFRLALESAPIGMAVVSLDRRFLEVNPALSRMLGRPRAELLTVALPAVIDPADDAEDLQMRAEVLSGQSRWATREKRLLRSDGSQLWVQHAVGLVRSDSGEPLHYVSQFVDISERLRVQQRLEHLASHDSLTGLMNRSAWLDTVGAWAVAGTGPTFGALYLDLDGFKQVNDTRGHAAGDHLLRIVADRLRSRVRSGDLVARFGGDEFVVALPPPTSPAALRAAAEQLLAGMADPVVVDGAEVRVSLSIGAALARSGEGIDSVLARADRALYRAKAAGGGFSTTAE